MKKNNLIIKILFVVAFTVFVPIKSSNLNFKNNVFESTIESKNFKQGYTITSETCFTFTSNATAVTITGYNGINDNCPSDIVIPSTINELTVKYISTSAFLNKQLKIK